MHTMLESLMILLFEMMGTAMLTSLFLAFQFQEYGLAIFIGFFVLLIFSARISGSHYNPIVTLAFMLRRDAGKFNRWLGILYMLFQLGGALIGALLSYFVFRLQNNLLTVYEHPFQCMLSETLGSFILVVLYLTQTEQSSKLTEDAALTTMIISASYTTALALAHTHNWALSPLNPAIALAEMTMTTFAGNIDSMQWSWIFLTFGWLGAVIAVLVFEFGVKKAQAIVETRAEDEDLEREMLIH